MPQFENELNNIDWNGILQNNDLDFCNILMKTLTELIGKYTQILKCT